MNESSENVEKKVHATGDTSLILNQEGSVKVTAIMIFLVGFTEIMIIPLSQGREASGVCNTL